MIETISVSGFTKKEQYESLIPQIKSLIEGERDSIANLSNIIAALKFSFHLHWVGIYFVKNTRTIPSSSSTLSILGKGAELVLGPFQGPVACTRIPYGKGVCGKCWELKKTIIVDDVDLFPEHIACSALSKSEIVLPTFNKKGEVILILDIDSENLANFDETDRTYLQKVIEIITGCIDVSVC